MKFQVDTAQLRNDVSSMTKDVESLKTHASKVQSSLSSLDGMWIGEAHDAFVIQRDNDYKIIVSFLNNLANGLRDMGEARQNYDTCEEDVKAKIRSIQI